MKCQPTDLSDVLFDLLCATRYNREFHDLSRLLRSLRDRLTAFAHLDPTTEMVDALVARGMGRATAASEVVEYLAGAECPADVQEVARSIAWFVNNAAGELDSVSYPLLSGRPRRLARRA